MTDSNVTDDLDLEYKDVVNPSATPLVTPGSDIPEKYKGKSLEDVITMHVNAERVIARQGNDLGQLRKTNDDLTAILTRTTAPTQTEKKPEVNAEQLLNDPTTAVNTVVAASPAVQSTAQRVDQLELQVRQNRFDAAHPTWKDDLRDPQFEEWVLKSPVRQKLLLSLHHYNFDAGAELWELYNEHRSAKAAAESARQARVTAAGTIKTGAGEPLPKPILSRVKLSELQMRAEKGDAAAKQKWEDPEFQRMRLEAYAEGRIK